MFEPYGRPFVPSPSSFPCSEVSNVMGIASQLFTTVLPSDIPSSSPSSFERRVLCLWQRDLPRDEEFCVPRLFPSYVPSQVLSLIPNQIPSFIPSLAPS